MNPAKLTPAQLARLVAEGKKRQVDLRRMQKLERSHKLVSQAGKSLGQIAQKNPQV